MKITGVEFTPLLKFENELGVVYRALRHFDPQFNGFGEVYFSSVNHGVTKGWKKHSQMLLNLVVPAGEIQFFLYDDRPESKTKGVSESITLSTENYGRLTIPPGIWVAFRGIGLELNLLMNFSNIVHDPQEAENLPLHAESMPSLADQPTYWQENA